MEGDGEYVTGMVGESFDLCPGLGIIDVNILVARPSGEKWFGQVEGDGGDVIGMAGEGFPCKIEDNR